MSKKILVIDDNNDTLEVMQEALDYLGFEVICEDKADDIFDLLKLHDPSILIIDYLLQGINRGEICSQVKKHPATSHLPVVIMSAYPRGIESLGFYNCDTFVAKPFNLDHLDNVINNLTNGKLAISS